MNIVRNKIRFAAFGLIVALAMTAAPAAMARGHVSIGIGLPGLSIGVGNGYYGGYVAPAYYAPSPVYYAPAYYPGYSSVYYGGYGRGYHGRPSYRGGSRGYYHRGYQGRGGYYRHR